MDETFKDYLKQCDENYGIELAMLGETVGDMGYHTSLPPGSWAHPTRQSLDYALALLQAGGKEQEERAADIIAKVISLQDADPLSRSYGIWSWYQEEPIEKMRPPDWNWADFLGARLAQVLSDHAAQLPAALVASARAALGHAARSIFRRNVGLDYTNIAIMGGGVAAAAGELLDEPSLLEYGRRRLQRVVELTHHHGSFTEYNSPCYTMVALEEPERILHICRDGDVRAAAEALRRMAWQVIAEHFHPGTRQWAGPHSRAYSDFLDASTARYLSRQTGVDIAPHPSVAVSPHVQTRLVPALPCPAELVSRFAKTNCGTREIRKPFMRLNRDTADRSGWLTTDATPFKPGRNPHRYDDRVGTTWFSQDACLGSINHDDIWFQRRAVLGYWRTDDDPAVVLRLRFLHDGKDFASAYLHNVQSGPRILSAVTFLTDRGDHHPFFDHPKDDVFAAADFRMRYQLSGAGVRIEKIAENCFALIAGGHQAVVHALPGRFGADEVRWECGQEGNCVFVDAVCHHGDRRGFNLKSLGPVRIAAGLELLEPGQSGIGEHPHVGELDEAMTYEISWAGMSRRVPAVADVYPT